MTPTQMLKVYADTTEDREILDRRDPRRKDVIAEMREVLGKSRQKAKEAVEWWGWDNPQQMWAWIRKARNAAGVVPSGLWETL